MEGVWRATADSAAGGRLFAAPSGFAYNGAMAFSSWLVLGSWAVFVLYWTISAFGVKRDAARGGWTRGLWLRVLFLLAAIAVLRLPGIRAPLGRRLAESAAADGFAAALGALLAVLGIGLALYARFHLGRNWSPVPAVKEGHELVTTGPYRAVRHPIYTGILAAMFGSGLAVSRIWFVVFFAAAAVFAARIRAEEKLMTEKFPEAYPIYRARTWALVPFLL